jgi:protein-disulfide isomerase
MGFTVSLLVARRAFGPALFAEAQLGLLAAVVCCPLLALTVFRATARLPTRVRIRQLQRTAAQLVDLSDEVDRGRDHIRGSDEAPVTLVEYADFECPFCGRAEPEIRELLEAEGDELRYIFRHLPLTEVHPFAELAAEASEAAGAQGRFWEMHDLLFEHQGELRPRDLQSYAAHLGLDVDRFDAELHDRRYEKRVRSDIASADASGVSGTPSFFVNGRRHHGAYDLQTLTAAVKTAAKLAQRSSLQRV